MPRTTLSASALILAGLLATGAIAQPAPASSSALPSDTAGMPRVQSSTGGISYLSGGAGEEERQAMDQRQAEFPLKVVLSAPGGNYIVADKLALVTAEGELLVVRDAGPIVMIKAPQGGYTVEVVYQGRTQRVQATIGGGQATLQMRIAGS